MKRTDLARYLDLVRRRWQMLVLIVALVVGASLLQSLTSTKLYETTSRVIVVESNAADVVVARPSRDLGRALPTERRALESQQLRALVTEQLRRDVDVRFGSQSPDLLTITARDSDPNEAAVAANIFASTFVDFRKSEAIERIEVTRRQLLVESESLETRIVALEQELDANPSDRSVTISLANRRLQQDEFLGQIDAVDFLINSENGGLQLGETASVPERPVSPRPLRGAAFALVLGSILALAIALALEAIDDTVRSGRRLAGLTKGAPVLGVIPPYAGAAPTVATLDMPNDPATEAYSNLRTAFLAVLRDQTRPIVQVTSAGANEGKSVVATNLAVTLSQIGLRVALVDADLRNPSLRRFFPQLPETGLAEILEGSLPIDTQLSDVGETMVLHALPAGLPGASPAELLSSPTAKQVFGRIAVEHDVTIVDTSSVIGFADANVIAALADFTLMVVRAGETKSEQVRRAFDALALIDARPLGVVLTDSRDSAAGAQDSFSPARRILRRSAGDEPELMPAAPSGADDGSNVRQIRQASSSRVVGSRDRRATEVDLRDPAEGFEPEFAAAVHAEAAPLQPDDPVPSPLAVYDVESGAADAPPMVDPAATSRLGTAAAIAAVHQTALADETSPTVAKPNPVPPAPPPESAIADAAADTVEPTTPVDPETTMPAEATAPVVPATVRPKTKGGASPSPAKAPAVATKPAAKAPSGNTPAPTQAKPDKPKPNKAKAAPATAAPAATANPNPGKATKPATKRPESKVSGSNASSAKGSAKSAKPASPPSTNPSPTKGQAPVPPPPPESMTKPASNKSSGTKASKSANSASQHKGDAAEPINLNSAAKRRSKGSDPRNKSTSPVAPKPQE